jgi:GT2 family glycosyltransferase
MDLSIIIVNYNVKYFLEQCLHSVLNSSKKIKSEIFVVDNNSVDGSCMMIKEKFPMVKLIENKKNLGFARANNQAIKKATGKYILILNPDTVVEEDTFEKCLKFMESHKEAGSLGVKMIDGKGRYLPESKRSLPTPEVAFYKIFGLSSLFSKSRRFGQYHLGYLDKEQIHEVDVLPGAFILVRKKLLLDIGLLDENFFMYGEDIDLSYRIKQAGYKNYYFPETTIIHYKGESTKKGSINYVVLFYNAMIIFAKKHFSRKNASFFSFLINTAIYFRAVFAILRRSVVSSINPLLNALVIYLGYYFFSPLWGNIIERNYPSQYLNLVVPSYILVWLVSIFLSGGYERLVKIGALVRGVIFGTFFILVIYALLPENLRFSRVLILFGTIWALLSTIGIRLLLNLISKKNFKFEIFRKRRRIIIVGDKEESTRVYSILRQTQIKPELVGTVSPSEKTQKADFIGDISQIKDIVEINKVDELIFCAKDMTSQSIIKTMLQFTDRNIDFKIAPPESLSVIGSNSIDTAGDLYVVNFNTISRNLNKRKKRLFDISIALILLGFSPFALFITGRPLQYFVNIFSVLLGFYSFVGYHGTTGGMHSDLPHLKKSILSPLDGLSRKVDNKKLIEKMNMLYAKDYKLFNDLIIVFKGFSKLARKISK